MGLAMASCSQLSTKFEATDGDESVNLLRRQAVFALPTGDSLYVERIIQAADGGTLSLLDVELNFPPGALDSDTLASICIPNILLFENRFGTHGLVFNHPVRVVMSYRDADLSGVDESTITIAWFDEGSGSWDRMECVLDTVNKTVSGYLNHFSAYALISD
jgi:hypothetical protein